MNSCMNFWTIFAGVVVLLVIGHETIGLKTTLALIGAVLLLERAFHYANASPTVGTIVDHVHAAWSWVTGAVVLATVLMWVYEAIRSASSRRSP